MTTDIGQVVKRFFANYPKLAYEKGELLIRAEEPPEGVFYIVEGRIIQYDISPAGNEAVVNSFKPGAFFPMSWALNQTDNHYFFQASTKVVVHRAQASDAVRFLQENPEVTLDLLARVYRGTDGVLRRMAHLMGGDAQTRLQFELLNAGQRFGKQQADGSLLVPLKEGELAKQTGMARETVNRHLQLLKTADLVRIVPQGFLLPDPKRLEEHLGDNL